MKYLKVQFEEEEFTRIVNCGLQDVAYKSHEWIMNKLEEMETKKYGNTNKLY